MKTMLKNKSSFLVILSLLVMLSGVACTSDKDEDPLMKEGEKTDTEGTPKDTMMKEGEKTDTEGTPKDTMMKEGEKTDTEGTPPEKEGEKMK
ncbi:MAG: hypothetical protein IH923_12245 [Nitrospinae bacterium]|nr:hypothetical protein [Nitrospinota bacterium]